MPSKYRITTDQGTYEVTVDDGASDQPSQSSAPGMSAIALAAGQKALPMISHGAASFANNPDAWKIGKVVGELGGGIGGLVKGGGNPLEAAGGSYIGGKLGWRTSNLLQRLAGPVANATRGPAQTMLNTVEPYMSPLSIAQGGLGLAQAAEPKRKDIGFLGIGPKVDIGELSNPNPTGKTYPSPSPSEQVQWVRDHIMQLLGK